MTLNSVQVTVCGNSGRDPELRYAESGTPVASFTVAVTPRKRDDRGEWGDGNTTWYRVSCFGSLAQNVAESVQKGDRVLVTGQLEISEWMTKDGQKRTTAEIAAEDIAPSLAFRSVKVGRDED